MTDQKVYCGQCRHKLKHENFKDFNRCAIISPYTFPADWDEPARTVQYRPYCQHKNRDNNCPDFEPIPEHGTSALIPEEPKKPWWKFWSK